MSQPLSTVERVTVYHYEAHCAFGNAWTVLLEVEPDDDPMVECVGCGADVYDLRLVGQHHEAVPMSSGSSADRQSFAARSRLDGEERPCAWQPFEGVLATITEVNA